MRYRIHSALLILAALLVIPGMVWAAEGVSPAAGAGGSGGASHGGTDFVGAVVDSSTGHALEAVEVILLQGTRTVAHAFTDDFGQYVIHDVPAGSYALVAQVLGYRPARIELEATGESHELKTVVRLAAAPIMVSGVDVSPSKAAMAIQARSGNQVFKQDEFHGAPTNTTSQILQQAIAGAARAPTGEVHIRGQHAEYTYYVDGVPVPPGISGSLNELFDPSIVQQIEFQTGGWDAEFGNRNTAIVNVATRIPVGGLHAEASAFGGSFGTNGQELHLSSSSGRLGMLFSGTRQASDMRQEPVVMDPVTKDIHNFHNHGDDLSGFGKLQFRPDEQNVVDFDVSSSQTKFEVPYDSTGGAFLDDHQKDRNSFVNIGWRHRMMSGRYSGSEWFAALLYRQGSLTYTPGAADIPQFIFFPDTLTPYTISEDRHFNVGGLKADGLLRLSEKMQFKAGASGTSTSGHEDFETFDASGNPGPASNSGLTGSDIGVYGQTMLAPNERVELRAGVRYDRHEAPFTPAQDQVSPRVRLNVFLDPQSTAWIYYGRLFMPTNVENLRAITSSAQGGEATQPTLPERDDFYEAGVFHRFPVGVVTKLCAYYKSSAPGIDDNTVPGSSITTSVNIDQVRVTGIESVIEVQPPGPLSGYLNLAICHAYGRGPITGGFFPADTPPGYFDLDHDQRYSGVASVSYGLRNAFASATGIYGSGLTNGQDPDASYSTDLFALNQPIKVDPSFILNLSAGYSAVVGAVSLKPEVYVDNVFDQHYILKGAFFSGASVGRPRSVQVRVSVSM